VLDRATFLLRRINGIPVRVHAVHWKPPGAQSEPTAETEVETRTDDARGTFDIDESSAQPSQVGCETDLISAEIVIIKFDEA